MTYVANAPLATYGHPDISVSLDKLLPPLGKDLLQMQLTATLSGICWGNLGSSDLIQFFDQSYFVFWRNSNLIYGVLKEKFKCAISRDSQNITLIIPISYHLASLIVSISS